MTHTFPQGTDAQRLASGEPKPIEFAPSVDEATRQRVREVEAMQNARRLQLLGVTPKPR